MSAPLKSALARLDALLAREVRRLRTRYQLSLDEFRGLYVSDEQVDALLAPGAPDDTTVTGIVPPLLVNQAWMHLASQFALSPLEQDVLLLAVAADIEPRYPPLFAYLNDDVALRWPTFDLARRLLARDTRDRIALSHGLAPDGRLFGTRLLSIVDRGTERRAAGLTSFAAAPSVADILLDAAPRLPAGLTRVTPSPRAPSLADLAPLMGAREERPVVLLQGDWGSGRRAAACALTETLGLSLIAVTIAPTATRDEMTTRLAEAVLEARLRDGALFIDVDALTPDAAFTALAEAPIPVFLAASHGAERWALLFKRVPFALVPFAPPEASARTALWTQALAEEGLAAPTAAIALAADAYRLTPGRIAAAAASARIAARTPRGAHAPIAQAELLGAARRHATLDLAGLAQSLRAENGWGDLVLPHGTLTQLQEFTRAIVHRERVFRQWGFARQTAPAGLSALLAGASGTGKTMSATVIAHETGLDLWRIDLSAVVSKYIGETEKHLDQIFRTAREGNAILFFDEADALFGKRSDVKDAHDRYANIEVSYLLQRLEEHDGVCLLATNLAKNVDSAFSRRIHALIEFPLPDPPLRERLWRKTLAGAPAAKDIDYDFLARQFAFAGGDIRITCLDAAFQAAAKDGEITMAILIQAVARQLQKQGRIPSATEFRHYYPLLAGAPRASVA